MPLVEFTAAVSRLRAEHPTFRRKRFFTGDTVRTGDGERLNDIVWLHPDGHAMEHDAWDNGGSAIGMYLNGHGIAGKDARGETITDDHFLLYFNAGDALEVTLPAEEYAEMWDVVIDTGGIRRRAPRSARPGRPCRWRATRSSCSGSTRSPRPSPTTRWPRRSPPGPSQATELGPLAPPWLSRPSPTGAPTRAGQHLPAADHLGLRPARGGAATALPARPRRRLGLPLAAAGRASRAATHGYDVVAHDRIDASRGGADGLAARVGGGTPARHGRARRHRAQPRRRRRRRRRAPGGGSCSATGRPRRARATLRRRLGRDDGRLLVPSSVTTTSATTARSRT